jgi:hypothetical protein
LPTTAANYQDLAKEVWDSDTMVKQFYDENPWLQMIEKKQRVVIGKRAQVPLHTGRAGGTTVLDSAGGFINSADSEDVDRAEYTLSYNYFPVSIEAGALNEITGGAQSVGDALEHMMSSGISNMRNHVTRQFLTGHARVAAVATDAGGDTVVPLATLAQVSAGEVSGADALLNGWIVPGDVVEIGTTADYDSIVDRGTSQTPAAISVVAAVDDNPSAPTITLGANVGATTLGTHFVSLANARGQAGTGSVVESAGLVTIAGTQNNVVGNIDANVNKFWNPAEVDSSTTIPDMELLLRLTRKVRRRGGDGAFILTSLLQVDNVYQMLQSQVRFNGDREIGAGNSESFTWRGNKFHAFPQVPENFMFFVDMEALEIVVGKYTKPTWMSDIGGGGKAGHWVPGTTHFDDTVMYALGLAARRRNNMAAATNLKA